MMLPAKTNSGSFKAQEGVVCKRTSLGFWRKLLLLPFPKIQYPTTCAEGVSITVFKIINKRLFFYENFLLVVDKTALAKVVSEKDSPSTIMSKVGSA